MTSFGIGVWHTLYTMLRQLLMKLQTEILSIETSDSLKEMIFLKSFYRPFSHCYLPCRLLFNVGMNSYRYIYMGQYFGRVGAGTLNIFCAISSVVTNARSEQTAQTPIYGSSLFLVRNGMVTAQSSG